MINISEEKARVSIMQKTMIDINYEIAKLKKSTNDIKVLFSGTYADDLIVQLIDHVNKIDIDSQNTESKINRINGIIDNVYQEQLIEEK